MVASLHIRDPTPACSRNLIHETFSNLTGFFEIPPLGCSTYNGLEGNMRGKKEQ
jgi:hypothetical protein